MQAAAKQWQRQQHGGGVGNAVAALTAWWQHQQKQHGSSVAEANSTETASVDRRNTQQNQTDIHHLWIMARRRGDASGDARNRGVRRNVSGDASLDDGKEEGDLHRATINRGGRRNASADAYLDNGKEERDALGDASNAPPG